MDKEMLEMLELVQRYKHCKWTEDISKEVIKVIIDDKEEELRIELEEEERQAKAAATALLEATKAANKVPQKRKGLVEN
jgi:hypothetical protein